MVANPNSIILLSDNIKIMSDKILKAYSSPAKPEKPMAVSRKVEGFLTPITTAMLVSTTSDLSHTELCQAVMIGLGHAFPLAPPLCAKNVLENGRYGRNSLEAVGKRPSFAASLVEGKYQEAASDIVNLRQILEQAVVAVGLSEQCDKRLA